MHILGWFLVSGCTTGTSEVIFVTEPTAEDADNPYQGVIVTMGMYGDEDAVPGTEVMVLDIDPSQSCFGWTRTTGNGTRDNAAADFQCFQDRLCYTQYPDALTCDGEMSERKAIYTDAVVPDTGGTFTKILSGTEACEPAPEGFECPT